MEMRHRLSQARQYGKEELGKKITKNMHFHVRLTNMERFSFTRRLLGTRDPRGQGAASPLGAGRVMRSC